MSAMRLLLVVLLALAGARAGAQEQAVEFRIAESHPGLAGKLAPREQLWVRLAYRSGKPARFWIEAFAGGQRVRDGSSSNIQPLYRAGEGEALVWIAFARPTQIDEIRIYAAVDAWKPAATVRAAAPLEWSEGTNRRARPQWVERLNREQQEMVSRSVAERQESETFLGGVVIAAATLCIPAYFVLQPLLIWWWTGGWRIVALVPLIATVPLFGHAMLALAAGSNLWPILLIFFIPVAFFYLVIAAGLRFWMRRRAAP
jgi:hypothetical protein